MAIIGLTWTAACLIGGGMFAVSAWRYHRASR